MKQYAYRLIILTFLQYNYIFNTTSPLSSGVMRSGTIRHTERWLQWLHRKELTCLPSSSMTPRRPFHRNSEVSHATWYDAARTTWFFRSTVRASYCPEKSCQTHCTISFSLTRTATKTSATSRSSPWVDSRRGTVSCTWSIRIRPAACCFNSSEITRTSHGSSAGR